MEILIIEKLDEIKSLIESKSNNKFLDMKQVINYTSLSQSTIRRAIQRGELKCSNRTGKLLFNVNDVDRWLNG